jgi:hypothetical protein
MQRAKAIISSRSAPWYEISQQNDETSVCRLRNKGLNATWIIIKNKKTQIASQKERTKRAKHRCRGLFEKKRLDIMEARV